MGSLFSSPGKQASAAASAEQGISSQDISQLESYVNQQQGNLQNAIQNQGANPYFSAASQITPSQYAVNPNDTVSFGSAGPGTYTVPTTNPTTPVSSTPAVTSNPQPKTQTGLQTGAPAPGARPPVATPGRPVSTVPNPSQGVGGTTPGGGIIVGRSAAPL